MANHTLKEHKGLAIHRLYSLHWIITINFNPIKKYEKTFKTFTTFSEIFQNEKYFVREQQIIKTFDSCQFLDQIINGLKYLYKAKYYKNVTGICQTNCQTNFYNGVTGFA